MSNMLKFSRPAASRPSGDRPEAAVGGSGIPIRDRDGDIVRADRRIPESPQGNIEVAWLSVAEIRL